MLPDTAPRDRPIVGREDGKLHGFIDVDYVCTTQWKTSPLMRDGGYWEDIRSGGALSLKGWREL